MKKFYAIYQFGLSHDDVIKWKHFPVTGPLCGEFTGHQWIPCTKASDVEFWFFLSAPWINGWVNNHEAGDLRHHRAHYDVILMVLQYIYVCLLAIEANIKPTSLQVPVIPFGNWRALKVSWMVCIITGFLIVKKKCKPPLWFKAVFRRFHEDIPALYSS